MASTAICSLPWLVMIRRGHRGLSFNRSKPSPSGRRQSEITRSKAGPPSASVPSESVEATVNSNVPPWRSNERWMILACDSSSSTSSTRRATGNVEESVNVVSTRLLVLFIDGLSIPRQPVEAESVHHFCELIEFHWFYQIAVGVVVISGRDIPFRARRGKHNDRNAAQFGRFLNDPEHLKPIDPWQPQIEKNDVWPRAAGRVGVNSPAEYIIQRRLAVRDAMDLVYDTIVRQLPNDNLRMVVVVFHQEYPQCVSSDHCFPSALPCGACKVNQNVEPPLPGDSIQMRPPCVSIILLTMANPAPLPPDFGSSLSKRRKILS